MLKKKAIDAVRYLFNRLGIQLIKTEHWPFGVDWIRDIGYFGNKYGIKVAFDIGAHSGKISTRISKTYTQCRVFAFEPVPATYGKLLDNIRGNPMITPFQIAIGDRPGKGTITNIPLSGQNTMLVGEKGDVETIEVEVDTVDNFCMKNNISKINIMKTDTEGYDLKVLYGAQRLLEEKAIDFIVLECDFLKREDEPHTPFIEIFDYLKGYNFNVVSFYTSGVDDLGWVWGDVLFKNISGSRPGRISGSPENKKQN
ncbi:MAG: FkbM family methyltransferase [Syntrophorhabdaceae bacterium]|nr:FkbM family methyltransferase [Syntrophorhabdaceae bacterium]